LAIQFLGANQRVEVQVGGQIITAMQQDNEAARELAAHTAPGQKVALQWAMQHMVMLDA
jgi:hypothetical protein